MLKIGDRVKVYGQVGHGDLGEHNKDVGYGYLRGKAGVVEDRHDTDVWVKIGENCYEAHEKQLRKVKFKRPKVGTKVKPTRKFLDFHRGDWLRSGYSVPGGVCPLTLYPDKSLREMLVLASADEHPLSGEVLGYGNEGDCVRVRLSNCFGEYTGYVGFDDVEKVDE